VIYKVILLVAVISNLISLNILYALIGKVIYRHIQRRNNVGNEVCSTRSQELEHEPARNQIETSFQNLNTNGYLSKTDLSETESNNTSYKDKRLKYDSRWGLNYSVMFMLITIIFLISFIPKL